MFLKQQYFSGGFGLELTEYICPLIRGEFFISGEGRLENSALIRATLRRLPRITNFEIQLAAHLLMPPYLSAHRGMIKIIASLLTGP